MKSRLFPWLTVGALWVYWAAMSYIAFSHSDRGFGFVVALMLPSVLAGAAIGIWQALLAAFFWPLIGLLPERCVVLVDKPLVHETTCSSTSYMDQGPSAIVFAACLAAGVLTRHALQRRRGAASDEGTPAPSAHTGWQPPA